jgi:hypothetical protein
MKAAARLRVYFIEIWARGGSTTTAGGDQRREKRSKEEYWICTVRAPPDLSGMERWVGMQFGRVVEARAQGKMLPSAEKF